ncbi:hypothetical protein SCUCBS95973_007392 [Sporothrix curviconia]|uniref:LysM domain-containing protein n=1 Tax=Sporothrix curviconia TaxID=1260050 RepID=A0ABP0CCY2_9PEZI
MVCSAFALMFTAAVGAVGAVAVPITDASPAAAPHCYLHVKARSGDSCAGIAAVFNLDAAAFRRMNPSVTPAECSQLAAGTSYCVADGTYGSSTPPPTPRQSPITDNCRSWHLVAKGDTCSRVEAAAGISNAVFRQWNGFLDDDCTNLWLGYYCCVGV